MIFDTHTHLNDAQFEADRQKVIQRAQTEGVSRIVNVGFNRETINGTLKLMKTYDFIYAAVGWHPHDAQYMTEEDLVWIEELVRTYPKIVAIGEMGLDYHWDHSPHDIQKDVFRKQIRLAKRLNKPIIIHDRDAHDDVLQILKEENAGEVGGIMHCFGGDLAMAHQCIDMNFYISFGGPVTFKNAKLPKEVAKNIPLDKLLMETDAPYLAPHPLRGKRNESSYVTHVASAIAELRQLEYEKICQVTMENANRLFRLEPLQTR